VKLVIWHMRTSEHKVKDFLLIDLGMLVFLVSPRTSIKDTKSFRQVKDVPDRPLRSHSLRTDRAHTGQRSVDKKGQQVSIALCYFCHLQKNTKTKKNASELLMQ
jgi:hypothetical protein